MIHLGDRYYVYVATGAGTVLESNKTLDPDSPDYRWEEGPVVGFHDGSECNAIDPGLFLDPTDGRLWLTYGSYVGYIRLVGLDSKTGKLLHPEQKPRNIAINCEATDMIYRDGWYYLFATHGTCCSRAASTYQIRMGRSKKVTGPFIDNMGVDMLKGGGKLFCGSGGRVIGPGHFGLFDCGDGVQKFSCHYESDLDRGGGSVLDIRPLLWRDGWPLAGENVKDGTYEIESARTGTALEMAVEAVTVGDGKMGDRVMRRVGTRGAVGAGGAPAGGLNSSGGMAGGRGPGGFGGRGTSGPPVPSQDAAQVAGGWPAGSAGVRMFPYMLQAQQKWTIAPAAGGGGYPGSPYFKITIAGTGRALAATEDGELAVLPSFNGGTDQLWRIDQLSDGTYRIMTKPNAKQKQPLAISAVGSSTSTLSKFNPESDKQRWLLKTP